MAENKHFKLIINLNLTCWQLHMQLALGPDKLKPKRARELIRKWDSERERFTM